MGKVLLLIFGVFLDFMSVAQVNDAVSDDFMAEEHRQFDFWIGEWDVNLRVRQEDNSYEDAVTSTARIYRILDGKAILELWNENKYGKGIKGYSIRYYNQEKDKWELWLNWPGQNSSGSSSLEGNFRHGRGDFYSERPINDSTKMISRFSFNDITANSLRWDDAYSTDGGKSWTNQWIMEFSRRKDLAPALRYDQNILTYDAGQRCDHEEFRVFEKLEGVWYGALHVENDGMERPIRLYGYKVLDGCALIAFTEYSIDEAIYKSFSLKTYNTYAEVYEESVLTNQLGDPFHLYYGKGDANVLSLDISNKSDARQVFDRSNWTFMDNKIVWQGYIKEGEKWILYAEAELQKL